MSSKAPLVRLERSAEERTKYPDRINLDRRGLHGIPVLTEEPGLRLLSLQHNFIKRIHNLDFISRLVFLDLYHNRLDHIAGLEPLTNLRVLMLGKNRIRKIECLTDCPKLSVLDLHGNRISSIVGLEKLTELKVLNLASNLIRKVAGLQNLSLLEELNLRRNRIRTTTGLESVSSLQKLYMSNNEIQGLSSMSNLERLTKLQTIQMEGNPVWSNPDYSYHLVSSLPSLVTMDQQDVSLDTKTAARRWRETKVASRQPSPSRDQQQGQQGQDKSKALLFKKLEERNASITAAKHRWNFIKTKTLQSGTEEEEEEEKEPPPQQDHSQPASQERPELKPTTTGPSKPPDSEQQRPAELQITLEVPSPSPSPSIPEMRAGAVPKIIKRQSSERSLVKPSLSLTPPVGQRKSVGVSAGGAEPEVTRKVSAPAMVNMPPPLPIRDSAIRIKFPGLERRRFALPQRYETLNDSDESQKTFTRSNSLQDLSDKQKIGFFTVQQPKKLGPQGESSSTCQSDDEDLSGGFISDSDDSSDSESSDEHEAHSGFTGHTGRRILDKGTARGRSLAKNVTSSRSSSQLSEERGPTRTWGSVKLAGSLLKSSGGAVTGGGRKRAGQEGGGTEHGGRTSEQGKDYLIELDGDLLR